MLKYHEELGGDRMAKEHRPHARGKGMPLVAGIDIGGTQCSVNLGRLEDDEFEVVARQQFATGASRGPEKILEDLAARLRGAVAHFGEEPLAVGISCGGPLDREAGVVQSPPNLPGWDDVPVVDLLSGAFGLPCFLENDANAGALAEWHFGAGKGYQHVVFMTFGTGLGAGLVLDGKLFRGRADLAGELGHWRVSDRSGPTHYGKVGSLESFCSGSGIVGWYRYLGGRPDGASALSARTIAERARSGEALASGVFEAAARHLGLAVAQLADLLAPEVVVIGGIYGYANDLLKTGVHAALTNEVLPVILRHMQVLPAALGERLGSYASCCVALEGLALFSDEAHNCTAAQRTIVRSAREHR